MELLNTDINFFFTYDPRYTDVRRINLKDNKARDAFFAAVFERLGTKVTAGLFTGMEMVPEFAWNDGNVVSKLIGFYEQELTSCLQRAIERKPKTIVNIGCAEGFYACGLARFLPDARIRGYDIDPNALRIAGMNAAKNNLKNITFWLVDAEHYTFYHIAAAFYKADLIIMDCEGYELIYLDAQLHDLFKNCDVIVECHDFMRKKISEGIIERFGETHDVDIIKPARPAPRYELHDFQFLGQSVAKISISDFHADETVWLACWSRR